MLVGKSGRTQFAPAKHGMRNDAPASVAGKTARLALWVTAFVLVINSTTPAAFHAGLPDAIFRLPAGAWASGMGGAVAADPEYMLAWYNPSQLAFLRNSRASLGTGIRSLGRTEAWASYDFRVPPRFGMGLAFVYRGDPFLDDLYDGYYSGGDVVEEYPLNSATWSAVSLKIGAGYLVSRRFTLGGSIAMNYQSLPTFPNPDGSLHNSSVTSFGALDIAATYRMKPNLMFSAGIKNLLLSRNSWNIYTGSFAPALDETIPPVLTLSSSHKLKISERDFVWNAEAAIYMFDGDGFYSYIGRPEMVVAAGVSYRFIDNLVLKAGIADLELNGDIYRDFESYRDGFSPRVAIGFSYHLLRIRHGLFLNYSITTDRIWAGGDQQIDVTVKF
jgi:long-subunit fatty acid transport protein